MGRAPRVDIGGLVYHIVNRANNRTAIFHEPDEYRHFEVLLKDAVDRFNMRLLAYVLMPNHWHLLLYPRSDGDVSLFMQWLTLTHTQQYHVWKQTTGHGHIYQGRYKSFLVEKDAYLLAVIKYIERNPVRAKLARRAEAWKWGSGYRRLDGTSKERSLISDPPVDLPRNYRLWIHEFEKEDDLANIRTSVSKGKPLGTMQWAQRMIDRFGLAATARKPGRPKATP
jgi:putative transposase